MPTVLIEKQTPQITVLTLNRPERRNALTIELLSELNAAIKIASDQPQERVIILRGVGFEGSCRPDEGACDGRNGRKYFDSHQPNTSYHDRCCAWRRGCRRR